ncbi:unnamed protein product [Adineta steineri]|uniref:Uncharacterized protein n=1 Tax=Adineta steineri TaxID=433720 RepID=A0A814SZX5_9BILA|nr:unnamed protein product [Adineta steineri]CAF3737863.1 unnamed protein product [Adineta steineri]
MAAAHTTNLAVSRYTDFRDEPVTHLLTPIGGYEDMPLVSLEQAVGPISHLFDGIDVYLWTAKRNSANPADGLSQDESASIHLYTMEFNPEPSFYHLLNQNLRSENRRSLRPVIGQLHPGNDLCIIHLMEIQPPFPLIRPPFVNVPVLAPTTAIAPPIPTTAIAPPIPATAIAPPALPPQLLPPALNLHPDTKWVQNGLIVAGGNGEGNATNQLCRPWGVYVDDDQTVYVADSSNHRIVAWKRGATHGQVVASGNQWKFWNTSLNCPRDVVVDKERNNLIICDGKNQRVVRWLLQNGTSGGTIISNIDCVGLTMDKNRFLYVVDYKKHEVRRYRIDGTEGTVVAGGHGQGAHRNQLSIPQHVFVDRDHSVYVSDWGNHRVMKWEAGATEGIIVAGGRGEGDNLKQLNGPEGIVVDQLGTVYVVDSMNHRIMRWPRGTTQGSVIVGGNGKGGLPNQLYYPYGLSFDLHGDLYVVDQVNNRVQKFRIEQPMN